VVGKQLQWNRIDNRCLKILNQGGHAHGMDTDPITELNPWVGKYVQLTTACADFLQVALELFQELVIRRDCDDRHVFIDQRERSVLQFAGCVGFRVDV